MGSKIRTTQEFEPPGRKTYNAKDLKNFGL